MADNTSEAMVRAWSIQPWAVWAHVQANGELTVNPHYSANLHHCYEWLRVQLIRRIPGYHGHYPWWAYSTRPDLRQRRHHYPLGERYALLALRLPRSQTLTFAFWAWDLIFYGRFLSYTAEESQDWHQRLEQAVPNEEDLPALPHPWLAELETSWERLFAPTLPAAGWWTPYAPPVSGSGLVFEVLHRANIYQVTSFLGAHPSAGARESRMV